MQMDLYIRFSCSLAGEGFCYAERWHRNQINNNVSVDCCRKIKCLGFFKKENMPSVAAGTTL